MEIEWKARLHSEQFLGQKQSISLRDAIDQFCDSKRGNASYKSLLCHAQVALRLLPVHKPIDQLSSHDLERFKRDRHAEGAAPQTIKHNMNLIRGAWKLARKYGYQVTEVEFPTLKIPRSPLRYLSHVEELRLLECLDPKREGTGLRPFAERDDELKRFMQDAYDLVVLLLDTGARYGEIANIEWKKIDLDAKSISLWRPKVQNEAVIFMTSRVHEILVRRYETRNGPYVFTNKKGGPRGYMSQAIRKAIKHAGLHDCRIHTLRHTHASRLIQNGLSVYEVREVLGHTDIKTTMRYAHLEASKVTSKARDVINRLNQQGQESQSHF